MVIYSLLQPIANRLNLLAGPLQTAINSDTEPSEGNENNCRPLSNLRSREDSNGKKSNFPRSGSKYIGIHCQVETNMTRHDDVAMEKVQTFRARCKPSKASLRCPDRQNEQNPI